MAPGSDLEHSPFGKLSVELRNLIWEQAMSDHLETDGMKQFGPPPITRTCRTFRHETILTFYTHQRVHFECVASGYTPHQVKCYVALDKLDKTVTKWLDMAAVVITDVRYRADLPSLQLIITIAHWDIGWICQYRFWWARYLFLRLLRAGYTKERLDLRMVVRCTDAACPRDEFGHAECGYTLAGSFARHGWSIEEESED